MFLTIKDTKEKGYNILIVDDEPSYRKVMKRLLIKDGHSVMAAVDGQDGLRILEDMNFDLVLTDIDMPNMNGWEFLRNIEKLYPGLPAAVITGLSSQEKILSEDTIMAKKILKKPISIDEIRKLIEEIL